MPQFQEMQAMSGRPPSLKDTCQMPAGQIPSFKTFHAVYHKIERNLLLTTWGGIGDQICAEPTLRYALEQFKDCDVSLASEVPELFAHLKFKKVYDLRKEKPDYEKYFVFETIQVTENLIWEFMSHCIVHCVDYPALSAFRCQLPVKDREVMLKPQIEMRHELMELVENKTKYVMIHAGKHWPSKTFPKKWWDAALDSIIAQGLTPVLLGKETHDGQGTVDTKTEGCVDLRNKTTLLESIWLLQQMPVLFCNDSSPMHMAVTGDAFIGFVATCKHPDYIMHWRKGQWAWRMENLGLGGFWDIVDNCPNSLKTQKVDEVDLDILESWLPDPAIVGPWCATKMREFVGVK